MSLPVRRTNRAETDLDEIWLRIAQDNIAAAEEFAERVEAAENRLGRFPEIGQARPDLADDVRHWPLPPYLILYRVEQDCVLVVRIVHGARDLPRLFRA
ncbi:MAG TPA: type II toxin-antitoxin system RelE/ParE family toxin [Caulobacteraceae bacterium]|nr:type II toxin-antitoxin system RelE/ParE family toxin [Caulobacteraceae bacterium]